MQASLEDTTPIYGTSDNFLVIFWAEQQYMGKTVTLKLPKLCQRKLFILNILQILFKRKLKGSNPV